MSGSDLQLNLEHWAEWDNFAQLLKDSGVYLKAKADSLLWTGGDRSDRITAKNVYNALAAFSWNTSIASWRQRIWKASCPLKYKLFSWLMLENKLLFWDNLQARGWEGPSRCSLCARDIESSLHVFVFCSFTRAVWTATTTALKIPTHWSGNNIHTCFQNWILNSSTIPMLPIHICWHVWLSRNAAIFKDKKPSILHICSLILTEVNKLARTL
jgi:hypothetical protein